MCVLCLRCRRFVGFKPPFFYAYDHHFTQSLIVWCKPDTNWGGPSREFCKLSGYCGADTQHKDAVLEMCCNVWWLSFANVIGVQGVWSFSPLPSSLSPLLSLSHSLSLSLSHSLSHSISHSLSLLSPLSHSLTLSLSLSLSLFLSLSPFLCMSASLIQNPTNPREPRWHKTLRADAWWHVSSKISRG